MNITYTNGSKGTATVETGRHGGPVLVLRRGFPVAAEVVAGIKVEQATRTLLAALGVSDESAAALTD